MSIPRRCLLCALLCGLAAALAAAEVPAADRNSRADREREIRAYLLRKGPDYVARYLAQRTRYLSLRKQVNAREASGANTTCSHQVLAEVSWLNGSAMDVERIAKKLDDLEALLAHPELEARAEQQDPADGGWGQCHDEWFFKVNATFDHVSMDSHKDETPRYAFRLFDRVNSPEKLTAYFEGLAVSDIPTTGADHRKELNESLSNLTRLILRDRPASYRWDPRLKKTLIDLILGPLRNPATGWWGERYTRDGRTDFVDDLSVTFHVVSYLRDAAPELSRAMLHLLAVKDLDYPEGWRDQGHYSNHHNMDVVTLFRLGWRDMDAASRQTAAAEIGRMLDWCLKESLRTDGSFSPDADTTDSAEESTTWGVSFLSRIGYFDRSLRFWTAAEFPQAESVRQRLIENIRQRQASGGAGGTYYESALADLRKGAPEK